MRKKISVLLLIFAFSTAIISCFNKNDNASSENKNEVKKEMNLTISNHSNIKNTSGYKHYNDLEFGDLEEVVKSGFHYVACKLKNEIRNDNNFDGFVDLLILDIDSDCNIEQAKQIFS